MPTLPPHPAVPVPDATRHNSYLQERTVPRPRQHMGIDIFAPFGVDCNAVSDGVIVQASPRENIQTTPSDRPTSWTRELGGFSGFGNIVVLKMDGTPPGGGNRYVLYAHLSKVTVVQGERVVAGQKLGEVGTTLGTRRDPTKIFAESRAHCHLELSSGPYPKPRRTWITDPGARGTLDPTPLLRSSEEPTTDPDPTSAPGGGRITPQNEVQVRRPQRRPPEEPPQERTEALTQGRSETPSDGNQFGYQVITTEEDATTVDPHVLAASALNPSDVNGITQAPYVKFYEQFESLKELSNLDLTQATPVLAIFAREGDTLVNLNQLIFGESAFKNIFQSEDNFREQNPERPIASITSFRMTVQSPLGEAPISIANLNLRVHNPFLVRDDHPAGKYISYMMRMSYTLRIRFGVNPATSEYRNNNDELLEGLQWVERDFYVSKHQITMNDDLQMDLNLQLLPGEEKLFNQIIIGSSFPASAAEVTSQVQAETNNPQTVADAQATINAATNTSGSYVGVYREERRDGTIGHVLHGAVRNIDVLEQSDSPIALQTRIDNLISALRTVQAKFLTMRIRSIFEDLSYEYNRSTDAELSYVAVNCGPLFERLVRPELEQTVEYLSENQTRMGAVYSTEALRSDQNNSPNNPPTVRNRIRMVFGNFNARAGQWANRPISSFPVNIDKIIEYTRTERDIGKFNGSITNFINRIHGIISDPGNFVVDTSNEDRILRRPVIKYILYPDPQDPTAWVFYLYDWAEKGVNISLALRQVAAQSDRLTKEEIKVKLRELKIPWIEPGHSSSLIKKLQASTQADDQIASALLLQANRAYTTRQLDGSNIPSGISREFVSGLQLNLNEHIANTEVILPLHMTLTHYLALRAVLFGHIYIFFPIRSFSGLFSINELDHEVQNGSVHSVMKLILQVTEANRNRRN